MSSPAASAGPRLKVLMVAAAGRRHGLGHVMRCRTLAAALRAAGHDVLVWLCTTADTNHIGLFEAVPVSVEPDVATTNWHARLAPILKKFDWLVLDAYEFSGSAYYDLCAACGARLLLIDDLANRAVRAHAVLNPNISLPDVLLTSPTQADRLLLGPTYALVDDDYAEHPWKGGNGRTLLISFGGTDSKGNTLRSLTSIAALPYPLDIHVVLGPFAAPLTPPAQGQHRVTIHQGLTSLARLMQHSDIMISAAGTTCWQACCVGIPLISVQTADNQTHVTDTLRRENAAIALSSATASDVDQDERTRLASAVARLLDGKARSALSARARSLVDGQGAARVAQALRDS